MLICIGREINVLQCKLLERVLNYMFMNKLVNYESIRNGVRIYFHDHMTFILSCLVKSNIYKKNLN